jgi:hypothetical protein
MYSINYHLIKGRQTGNSIQWNNPVRLTGNTILHNLFLFGAFLVLLISAPVAISALEQPDSADYEKLDTRLLPWIGSWRLLSSGVNTDQNELVQDFLLTISPGDSENSLTMKGYRDGKLSAEEKIIVDGLRHQITDDKCTGWYQYSWSENGRRLLFNSESNCPGDPPRKMSGMSIFDEKGHWLDIQLLHNGEDIVTNTRKYRNVDSDSVMPGANAVSRTSSARRASGRSFTIEEIVELSSKVESEVLEAALLETGKPFPINSKKVAELADLKVPSRVIDLMVALSFSDKFNLQGRAISLARGTEIQPYYYFPERYHYCFNNYRYFPWHWTPYDCMPYGYTYLGWYTGYGWYYPLWTYPYYYTGGGGGGAEHGRLIKGQGYTRSTSESSSRYAVPKNAPTEQHYQPRAAYPSSGSPGASSSAPSRASSSAPSRASSSASSSTSSSASSSTSSSSEPVTFSVGPSASPSGYSRGNR